MRSESVVQCAWQVRYGPRGGLWRIFTASSDGQVSPRIHRCPGQPHFPSFAQFRQIARPQSRSNAWKISRAPSTRNTSSRYQLHHGVSRTRMFSRQQTNEASPQFANILAEAEDERGFAQNSKVHKMPSAFSHSLLIYNRIVWRSCARPPTTPCYNARKLAKLSRTPLCKCVEVPVNHIM